MAGGVTRDWKKLAATITLFGWTLLADIASRERALEEVKVHLDQAKVSNPYQ